jgi:cation:H+ antiporter
MIDLILFMWIGIFIVSLGVLIKSSDYFTESAEKIGIHFGIPAFIVGVTIVAFGTSLPELVSSLIAVFAGSSEIVAANVIGSNIANILLVLGIAAIIAKKFTISHEIESVDLPLLIGSAFLLVMMCLDGKFTFGEGIIMLLGIILYIMYAISSHKESEEKDDKHIKEIKKEKLGFSTWAILVASVFFIFVGAKYTIDSVIIISDMLNIGKDIIAVIAVALGTSLPELMVTVSAARRGNAEMAVGNVLGSNIFNSFMVMGIPALFAPWFVAEGYLKVSTELISFALPIMIIATMLYVFMTRDKKITQWEGWTLLLVYVFFVFSTFGLV